MTGTGAENSENFPGATEESEGVRAMMCPDRAEGTSSSDASGNPSAVVFSADDSYRDALRRFENRGFSDWNDAGAHYLAERVTYRHISPYLAAAERSEEPPRLKTAHDLLTFDRRFQSALFKFIGIFEEQMRAQYSHWMETYCGPFSIYDATKFLNAERHKNSVARLNKELGRRKEQPIKNMVAQNSGRLPVWEAVEYMTLGTLSHLFSNTADRNVTNSVAGFFGASKDELSSWLKSIATVRNTLAHFEPFIVRKQLLSTPLRLRGVDYDNRKPFYVVLVLAKLLEQGLTSLDLNLCYSYRLWADMNELISGVEKEMPELMDLLELPADWERLMDDAMGGMLELDKSVATLIEIHGNQAQQLIEKILMEEDT